MISRLNLGLWSRLGGAGNPTPSSQPKGKKKSMDLVFLPEISNCKKSV